MNKRIYQHLLSGMALPILLILCVFQIPEPYSHPFFYIGIAPRKLMPFLENKHLMRELTISLFGRMTPNYAPITILFLIAFWFVVGVLFSLFVRWLIEVKKSA